jgi:hypothetical protein
MLVYRSAERTEDSRCIADEFMQLVSNLVRLPRVDVEGWRELLIAAGELESAIADALNDERDDAHHAVVEVARLTRIAARGLVRSLSHLATQNDLAALDTKARAVCRALPAMTVRRSTPEGYAYYALYPETYAAAAEQFFRSASPGFVTVVGIRSIGTGLAAVVAAALEARGVTTQSFTVRPRGHPYARVVRLGSEHQRLVRDGRDGWFAVVDEGPGISGSSFASTAAALSELGVLDDRIVFLPSWIPHAAALNNADARARWTRHAKYTGTFEQRWLESDALAQLWDGQLVADWSAGLWRRDVYGPDGDAPPVHPQHEQRKYLCRTARGELLLLKFVGLGRYGAARRATAESLAASAHGPEVVGLRDGFLATRFVPGVPLSARDVGRAHLEHFGRYVARRAKLRTSSVACVDELRSMIHVNVQEALGDELAMLAASIAPSDSPAPAVAIDGRMLPHEWIVDGSTLIKTDGVAHHDDHFFPGPQDPAWDVAGCCVECCTTPEQEDVLVEAYVAGSGDVHVVDRLEFFRIAYLAFRTGYTGLASETLRGSREEQGMRSLAEVYRVQLRRALTASAAAGAAK